METLLTRITDYLLMQSWQIALLVFAVAVVSYAARNRSAHVRYLLWLIVLAKCLIPPFYTIPLAVLPQRPAPEPVVTATSDAPPLPFAPMEVVRPGPLTLPASHSAPVARPPVPRKPTIADKLAELTLYQWLAFGWIAGAVLFLLVAIVKALRTNRWLKRRRKPLPMKLEVRVEDLFAGLGVKSLPKVWLVDGIGQPFVWGLWRGSIYLPANFGKVNGEKDRRGVLGHELSHVMRYDALVNLLQIIAQAVYWFHPFVWWANKKIREEREKCCDEMAIARLNTLPKDYGKAIVNTLIAEHKSARPVPSLAVAGPVKNIEDRIKTIMKSGKKFYRRPTFITVVAVLLLAAIAVPTTLALTSREEKAASEKAATQTETDWGEPVDGLQFGLQCTSGKRAYRVGASLSFVLKVRNVGREKIELEYVKPHLKDWVPNVRSASGGVCPVLPPVRVPPSMSGAYGTGGGEVQRRTLEPGEEWTLDEAALTIRPVGWEGKVEQTIVFAPAGKYRVSNTLVFSPSYGGRGRYLWRGQLTSNEIELEIVPDGTAVAAKTEASAEDVQNVLRLLADYVGQRLHAVSAGSADGDAWRKNRSAWEARCSALSTDEIEYLGHLATEHPEAGYRAAACEALGETKNTRAAELLVGPLGDKAPYVRHRAARALGSLRSEKHIPELLRVLKSDTDSGVRAGAAFTLGNIGSKRATKGLAEALQSDKEGQVPEAVLFALMWIKDASALPPLRAELKQETNSERRRALENIIRRIEESTWGEPVDGVSVRLRAERVAWKAGEGPIFKIDLKSDRERQLPIGPAHNDFEVEVDGNWYSHDEKVDIRSFVDPSHVRERDGIHLFLGRQWQDDSGGRVIEDLRPGAHVVRVAYRLQSLTGEPTRVLRAVSNPVQIEILPTERETDEAAEMGWGEAADGLRCRWVRPTSPLTAPAQVGLAVEVQNVSEEPILWESNVWCMAPSVSGGGTLVEYRVATGNGTRAATQKEVRDRWGTGFDRYEPQAPMAGYYYFEPGGKLTLTRQESWQLDNAGQYKMECYVARYYLLGSTKWGPKGRMNCPPLIVQVLPADANEEDDSAWGEAVEGVQMRVRAERLVWRQDEIPLFKAQLRRINKDEGVVWEGFRERVEMEVDGQWYRSLLETSSTPFRLTPAKPINDFDVDLDIYHPQWAVWIDKGGNHLELRPGRHIVRVGVTVLHKRPEDSDVQENTVVSNPVQIEVLELPERLVRFPKDRSVGVLRVQPWRCELVSDNILWQELGQAKGDVVVPAGKQLWLQISAAAADDLSFLGSLRPDDLYQLSMYGDVTNAQLEQIRGLTGLRQLEFHAGRITDKQLPHLEPLKGLWVLNLFGKDISDAGLVHLKDMKSLKFLALGRTQVTPVGIRRLQKALPHCIIIHDFPDLKAGEADWGEAVEGLRMAVEFVPEKDSYLVGEEIGVHLHIQNVSDTTITVARVKGQTDPGYWIIEDSKGVRVRTGLARWMGPRRIDRRVIKLGETAVLEIEPLWILKSGSKGRRRVWAFIDEPGVYTARYKLSLRQRQQGDWSGNMESGARKLVIGLEGLGKGAEQGWGEAVEGVQCRLHPDELKWQAGDTPTLKVDIRNLGAHQLHVVRHQGHCEVWVDGRWYGWVGEAGAKSSPLGPGREYNDIGISLDERWAARSNGKALRLRGRHRVRVAFTPQSKQGEVIRVHSNPVEIEILPGEGGSGSSASGSAREAKARRAAAGGQRRRIIFLGLDLTDAPRRSERAELDDLFEERPAGSGSCALRDEVVAGRHPEFWEEGVVYYVAAKKRFYVVAEPSHPGSGSKTFYGPFEGEPWRRFGMTEPRRPEYRRRFAIYLVVDPVDVGRPEDVDIERLRLGSEPVLTEEDIVEYEWDNHFVKLTAEARKRVPSPRSVWGLPFVVVADGRRCYLGAFWSSWSSYLPRVPCIVGAFSARPADTIAIVPSRAAGEEDARNDWRIRKVLEELNVVGGRRGQHESAEKLERLGKALLVYANDDEQGRFPNTLRQLAKRDYLNEKELAWYMANVEYLAKGKTAATAAAEPTAYDKALLRSSKAQVTNVLFNDGHVALQDPQHLHELGIYMFVFPEGAVSKINQFREALAASDWDKALSYCSDRVKAAASEYESVEAFFRDIVPVEAVIDKQDMLRHPIKGNYDRLLGGLYFFPRSAPGDAEEELWWQFTVDKGDAGWVIDFETKSIRDWLEQRKKDRLRTAALEKERQALRKAFQWKLEAVKAKTRLTPVSKEFVLGRPMLLRLELVNEGKVELFYDHQQVAVNSSMTITDEKGARVPYTFGPVQTEGAYKAIRAGKSAILFDNLDISNQYDLSKAGKYKVQFNGKGLWIVISTAPDQNEPADNLTGTEMKLPPNRLRVTKPPPGTLIGTNLNVPSNIVEIEVSASEKRVREKTGAPRARTAAQVRIQLDRIVDLSRLTPEMPFSDALGELKKSVKPPLSMVVLWSDLEQNADIDRTTPIDMEGVSAIRLGTGLELLLQSVSTDVAELGYVVKNGVIVIATKESLPRTMETRVYDI